MSSSFPDNDTFQNHFKELLTFFKPPEIIPWSHVLLVEERSIMYEKICLIPRATLFTPEIYEKRFDELLSQGHSWVNMNLMGILDNTLIVQIEYPYYKNNIPRNKLSVNYSGPSILDNKIQWNLSGVVKITE